MWRSDILFNGYYGMQNTGDDAFIEVSSWFAKNLWGKSNIRYLSKKNRLPKTIVDIKGYPAIIPKSYGIQARLLISQTNAFISAGGSIFVNKVNAHIPHLVALQRKLKDKQGFIAGAIGVSLGPFKNTEAEKSTIAYLKALDFLTLRDRKSFEFAAALRLPYTPVESFDMAALLPEIYGVAKSSHTQKTIGISLCNSEIDVHGQKYNDRRNRQMTELIKALDLIGDFNFKFFILNGNPIYGDSGLTMQTISQCHLRNAYQVIDYSRDSQETWKAIAGCDFMISTRLHGAIFACFAKTPFVHIEYHRKCTDFLDDVGYDHTMRIGDAYFDPQQLAKDIAYIVDDPVRYNAPGKAQLMIEKARLNFTTVRL